MLWVIFICLLGTPAIAQEINPQNIFSNSIIIIKGSNTIALPSDNDKIRGVKAAIDWTKIPNIGLPKEEIHTIQVIARQYLNNNSNLIDLLPNIWRFIADKWTIEYYGRIPYLENLEFLSDKSITDLQMNNQIPVEQNALGYYQDKNTLYPGFYQHINKPSDNTVSYIYIVSSDENQYIYDTIKNTEVQLIEEQLLSIKEQPIKTDTMSDQQSDAVILENTIEYINAEPLSTQKPDSAENNKTLIDRSINTSIDKKKDLNQ